MLKFLFIMRLCKCGGVKMLIQFSVTNFLSFRDEMVLSLSTDKDNLLSYKNVGILPSVAVYGANAAGKSNLLC